jgi:putative pyruvate formate lyase activating enzyme
MEKQSRRDFFQNFVRNAGMLFAFPYLFLSRKDRKMTNEKEKNKAYPSYIDLYQSGELDQRIKKLKSYYQCCTLCPRDCRVNRLKGETGKCQATASLKISSAFAHFGEERPLVGTKGSGTIFFSNCGLRCIYCQNYTISIKGEGVMVDEQRVAESMMKLQALGCHNINLVTPTHYVPGIVSALKIAVSKGLEIPLVYNTGGYEKLEILKLLDGIVDIYLPDYKYTIPESAAKYSSEAYNYPYYVQIAFKEMYRQVGNLVLDRRGVAKRGLMIRHLILPNRVSGSREFLEFVAKELSKDGYLNLMRQYRPEYRAREFPEINRRISGKEYREVLEWADELGFSNLDR